MLHADYLKMRHIVEEESSAFFSVVSVNCGLLDKEGPLHDSRAGELRLVEVARDYMRANFCDRLRVEEIAREVFMSQYHFSRIFKKYTSYSPYQYLLEIRLQHARKLMSQKGLSIKEITFRSGFNSMDYFSAAFSKKFSVCPSLYKKRLHNN
jgi:transcriptional regulator GlxA family with amidase domain